MAEEKPRNPNYGGARPGAGRPKGTTGIKKKNTKGTTRVVFQVSCQPDELEYITELAQKAGMTKSAYMISLLPEKVKLPD